MTRRLWHANVDRFFVGNSEFYNLPRKFKISLTGCKVWCSYPEINDVGLTGLLRKRNRRDERGFSLRVGGGLSTQPHLAQRLNAFVGWNQVIPVDKHDRRDFSRRRCAAAKPRAGTPEVPLSQARLECRHFSRRDSSPPRISLDAAEEQAPMMCIAIT